MNRLFVLIAILASSAAIAPAQSRPATQAHPTPAKVAVVSFDLAVFSTNEFHSDYAALQKKYQPKSDEIKSLTDEIKSLQAQRQTQGDKLSDRELAALDLAVQRKQIQLRRLSQSGQNDFQQDIQQNYSTVAARLSTFLAAYARQHGYTLVIGVVQQNNQNRPVLWSNPAADITHDLIRAYNAQTAVSAAPPAAPAARPHHAAH